jgi:hypothetical protein
MNFILLLSFAAFSLFQGCYTMEDNNKKRRNENQEADQQLSKKQKLTFEDQQKINEALEKAFINRNLNLAITLIEEGADVNFQSEVNLRFGGQTLLMRACKNTLNPACTPLFKLFLSKGADVNAKDKSGWTALHYACNQLKPAHVKLLLDSGALMTKETQFGQTPLHLACCGAMKENVQIIIKHIKELTHTKSLEKLAYVCSLSKKFREQVEKIFLINNRLDREHKMPKYLCYEIAHMMYNPDEILCELVNMKDNLGKTPLDRASEAASIGLMGPEREQEILALLTPYENIERTETTGCIIL